MSEHLIDKKFGIHQNLNNKQLKSILKVYRVNKVILHFRYKCLWLCRHLFLLAWNV